MQINDGERIGIERCLESPSLFVILSDDLAGCRVHEVDLSAGEAGHSLEGILVGNVLGNEALNARACVGAAVRRRAGHPC